MDERKCTIQKVHYVGVLRQDLICPEVWIGDDRHRKKSKKEKERPSARIYIYYVCIYTDN